MATIFGNPLRPVLLAAARSSRLERALSRVGVTRRMVDRFVPGESERAVVASATELLASGRFVSVDYLGEHTTDTAQARATVKAYLSLLTAYGKLSTPPASTDVRPLEVSIKLSALGQSLPHVGHQVALDNARTICAAAKVVGSWVTVDAEDHTTTDSTLSIVRELRQDYPHLGTVLQAYLHRTEKDCRELSGPYSRIRLCKGAYSEPATVAFQKRSEVDDSYLRCLEVLFNGKGYPMVASHDPTMIAAAQDLASTTAKGPDEYEFQMLYGIRSDEQIRLVSTGHQVRVYVPFGTEWYGYFMRRLAERPANLAFFLRSLVNRSSPTGAAGH
jgi:proline dehydrogenase